MPFSWFWAGLSMICLTNKMQRWLPRLGSRKLEFPSGFSGNALSWALSCHSLNFLGSPCWREHMMRPPAETLRPNEKAVHSRPQPFEKSQLRHTKKQWWVQPTEPCPKCRFVRKTEHCCFKPLTFEVVCHVPTDNENYTMLPNPWLKINNSITLWGGDRESEPAYDRLLVFEANLSSNYHKLTDLNWRTEVHTAFDDFGKKHYQLEYREGGRENVQNYPYPFDFKLLILYKFCCKVRLG